MDSFSPRVRGVNRRGPEPQGPWQQIYLRALEIIPNLAIQKGTYRIHRVSREWVNPLPGGPTHVEVYDPKEKGSDVNLASCLLVHGFRDRYDVAVVISNDSDLCLPIKMVCEELGKAVIVACPTSLPHRHPSKELQRAATSLITIRQSTLRACQFPDVLTDRVGTFSKPLDW